MIENPKVDQEISTLVGEALFINNSFKKYLSISFSEEKAKISYSHFCHLAAGYRVDHDFNKIHMIEKARMVNESLGYAIEQMLTKYL